MVRNFKSSRKVARDFKVLVVEDSLYWQHMIGKTLRAVVRHANVQFVNSIEEAKTLLNQNGAYDLIVSDHFFEGDITGLDFWKFCRGKYQNTPFLLVSALTEGEFIKLISKEAGNPLYISKPFEREDFRFLLNWQLGLSFGGAHKAVNLQKPFWLSPSLAAVVIAAAVLVLGEIYFQF
jgi:CheY-like chemotaxis protein